MTVKELINHLQQFEQETEVMFSYLDHTDFLYKVNFYEEDVVLGDVISDEDYDGESELFDDEFRENSLDSRSSHQTNQCNQKTKLYQRDC
jgi:hypothetical protein